MRLREILDHSNKFCVQIRKKARQMERPKVFREGIENRICIITTHLVAITFEWNFSLTSFFLLFFLCRKGSTRKTVCAWICSNKMNGIRVKEASCNFETKIRLNLKRSIVFLRRYCPMAYTIISIEKCEVSNWRGYKCHVSFQPLNTALLILTLP